MYFPLARRVRHGVSVLPLPRVDRSCLSSFARRGWKGKGSLSEVEEKIDSPFRRGKGNQGWKGERNISFLRSSNAFFFSGRGSLVASAPTSALSSHAQSLRRKALVPAAAQPHAGQVTSFRSSPARDIDDCSCNSCCCSAPETLRFRPHAMLRPASMPRHAHPHHRARLATLQSFEAALAHPPSRQRTARDPLDPKFHAGSRT